MRPALLLLLAAAIACPTGPAHSQTTHAEFSVVSYNVQFLPGLASAANKRKQPEYRARRIAEEVSAYDIVAIQEAFHEDHRPVLLDALRDAWDGHLNVVVAPRPEGFYANGGTLIATRYPVLESNAYVYTKFSTPEEYGISADGYSAKGVIHARLQLPGNRLLDIFNTHLEAREPKFRPSQYRELAEFIASHGDPAIPAVLVGDLNTNGAKAERDNPASEYNRLRDELQSARRATVIVDLWPSLHPDELGGTSEQESTETGKRIDYIIVLQPAGNDNAVAAGSIQVESYLDGQVSYLSDHNAVIARLGLNGRE